MVEECVIDTTVLHKANQPITTRPRKGSLFAKRIQLLNDIQKGKKAVLFSKQLLAEYVEQVRTPRNDYITAFFKILADPQGGILNYAQWPGRDREKARKCRYPKEDDPVLRTAIRPNASTIFTEEKRMLKADQCIYREFRVHIRDP